MGTLKAAKSLFVSKQSIGFADPNFYKHHIVTAEHHPFVDVLAMRLPEGSYDQGRLSMEMSRAHNVCSKGGGLSNKIVGVEFTLSCGKIMS